MNEQALARLRPAITHQGPQYDTKLQSSNFFPDKWSASQAPQLYNAGLLGRRPGPVRSPTAWPSIREPAHRSAPSTSGAGRYNRPEHRRPDQRHLPGRSGDPEDELHLAGDCARAARRLCVRRDGRTAVRHSRRRAACSSTGRPGQYTFAQIGNPPDRPGVDRAVFDAAVACRRGDCRRPLRRCSRSSYYDAKIPTNVMWNAGVQMALPWSSSLDVSYVGTHGYNMLAYGCLRTDDRRERPGPQRARPGRSVSAAEPGSDARRRARFPERPLSERTSCVPIRGLGTIYSSWPRFWTQYDSIQTSFNRRFSRGWQAGLNWTWSLRSTGNTSSPLHFVHNADGTFPTIRVSRSSTSCSATRCTEVIRRQSSAHHQGQLRLGAAKAERNERR